MNSAMGSRTQLPIAPGGVCAKVTGFMCPTSIRNNISAINSRYISGTSAR
jgi:hypothetical protein